MNTKLDMQTVQLWFTAAYRVKGHPKGPKDLTIMYLGYG